MVMVTMTTMLFNSREGRQSHLNLNARMMKVMLINA